MDKVPTQITREDDTGAEDCLFTLIITVIKGDVMH